MATSRQQSTVPSRSPRVTLSKERILEVGMDFVRSRGLAALTMSHLAAEHGVGEMTLYWHFPSKQLLIEAIADAFLAEMGQQSAALSMDNRTFPLSEEFRTLITEHADLGAFLCSRGPVFATEHGFRLADLQIQTYFGSGASADEVAKLFASRWMSLAGYAALMGGSVGRGLKGLNLAAWKERMQADPPDLGRFPSLAQVLPRLLDMDARDFFQASRPNH